MAAAPLFPSLKKEGQPGGGYDVKLNFQGFVLFLQFKLTDRMERASAKEKKKGVLDPPLFRMHLRSSANSDQHQLLLDLETAGNAVYYAAPEFTSAVELDDAYLNHQMVQRTVFIRPHDIGPLPDKKEHWVAFKPKAPVGYFLSAKPRPLPGGAVLDGHEFLERLAKMGPRQAVTAESYSLLSDKMQDVVLDELRRRREGYRRSRRRGAASVEEVLLAQEAQLRQQFARLRRERRPDEAVGYLARTFFGAEVLRVERVVEKQG